MKNLKQIPKFKNEAEEREFWLKADSTEYVDWSKAKKAAFPNLHPSTKSISLRLAYPFLAALKSVANKKDVPYQSLIKVYLAKALREEGYSL